MGLLSKDKTKDILVEELYEEYHRVYFIKYPNKIKEISTLTKTLINYRCDSCGKISNKKYEVIKDQIIDNEGIFCKKCLAKQTNKKLYGDENYCNKDKILFTKKNNQLTALSEDNFDDNLINNYRTIIISLQEPMLLKDIAIQLEYPVKSLIPKLKVYGIYHDKVMNEKFKTFCKCCGKEKDFKSDFCSRECQYIFKNKKNIFDKKLQELQSILNITILSYYKNINTKISCECNKCNTVWEALPSNLLNSKGCPICDRNKNKGYSEEVFLEKIKQNSPSFELLDIDYIKNNPSKVRCKDCNSILEVSKQLLRSGEIICKYCKSKVKSTPEILIENYLKNKNYNYEYQKTFKNLKGKRGKFFRYDFYLSTYNLCIEYDGEGHFDPNFYLNTTGVIDYTNDRIKESYCNNNNIKLLRIPYWERKNMIEYLDLVLDELTNFTSVITNNYRGKEYSHLTGN